MRVHPTPREVIVSKVETPETAAGRTIERTIRIAAPPEAVWRALTDPDELVRWFPMDARVRPGPDGSIWMSWRGEYEAEMPIRVWEPDRRLRTVWSAGAGQSPEEHAAGTPPPESALPGHAELAVDFHLSGEGGGTILRLVHSGFGEGETWDEQVEGIRRGWRMELDGLKHYLERHRGVPRLVAYVHRFGEAPREEVWNRLVAADGALSGLGGGRPGARFAVADGSGGTLEGTVRDWDPPRDFVGVVTNLNDALLRAWVDDAGGRRDSFLMLSAYGVPEERVRAIEESWAAATAA
jgi:uncharacterized protein YndB with AHSA1/START domain